MTGIRLVQTERVAKEGCCPREGYPVPPSAGGNLRRVPFERWPTSLAHTQPVCWNVPNGVADKLHPAASGGRIYD
jgi:hypothetical protein